MRKYTLPPPSPPPPLSLSLSPPARKVEKGFYVTRDGYKIIRGLCD